MDPRRSVRVEPDETRKQSDDLGALVRQPGDGAFGKTVAAAAQYPDRVRPGVDQPAVEIAQLDPELSLAETVFLRRRARKLGQFQHRLVDRGKRDIGLLAGGEPGH